MANQDRIKALELRILKLERFITRDQDSSEDRLETGRSNYSPGLNEVIVDTVMDKIRINQDSIYHSFERTD